MRHTGFIAVGLVTLLAGCDLAVSSKPVPPPTNAGTPTLPTSGGILAPGDLSEMAKPVDSGTGGAPALTPPTNAPATTTEVAGVGSGDKGRSLEAPGTVKMIAAPAIAFFRTKEQLAYNVQLVQAQQFYKAENGEGPKSHEEFMEKVVNANNIKLPTLKPNCRYIYDPATEQLLVERPENQQP